MSPSAQPGLTFQGGTQRGLTERRSISIGFTEARAGRLAVAHNRQRTEAPQYASVRRINETPESRRIPPAKSRANSGAHPSEKETRFPLAFLGVQGDGLLLLQLRFSALRQLLV